MSMDNPKPVTLEFFASSRIALNLELRNHPPLMEKLAAYESSDFPGKIGEVAAYCEVMVEGTYMPSELDRLCEILFFKLQEKNAVVAYAVAVTRND